MKLNYKNKRPLYISYAGPVLLECPLLNKGSAFTVEERFNFNLLGLLPEQVETIEEQTERAYQQLIKLKSNIDKHIYLRSIQDTNETLFYRLIEEHLSEILPIIYTPTVGKACEYFSSIYRRARGLFISYPNRRNIDDILQNATKQNVKVIVVTDGERILGLGDQGIGGIGIPIGKLSLYTACGGISPAYTLPVVLDVGTNNPYKLSDPMYMGWRHTRIRNEEYYLFIDQFINSVKRRWPNILLQFEDFAQKNAMFLLNRYRDIICCFNDDIQGTASVALAYLISATRFINQKLSNQIIVFLGAGSAGCGIAEYIIKQMQSEGISENQSREKIFMVDKCGLITDKHFNLFPFQKKLAQKSNNLMNWKIKNIKNNKISFLDVIRNAKPTILIGVSGKKDLFTKEIIDTMLVNCNFPIIMPLSNPTSKIEAHPKDIIRWTNGNVLIATGSPFPPFYYKNKLHFIPQCNNVYIFPGVGLGVIASGAKFITDNMFMIASKTLAENSPFLIKGFGSLLPSLEKIQFISKKIAKSIAKEAQIQGITSSNISDDMLDQSIESNFWIPKYRSYKRTSF
ncbi:MAG: NAD-dependent malic enzyme [Arsenophonus sp.]|nr:MAG: NAD-dependent malic enzyme [Arsenophonus sp.]